MSVSLEEASRCPKCEEPGEETRKMPGPKRSKVHIYTCRNERCSWLNTNWTVQEMDDGTIPERKQGPKELPPLTPSEEAMARAILEDNEAALRRGEIQTPFGR